MTLQSQIYKERLRTSPVFDWNYNNRSRIKINQGGTSSGKTYAIMQVIFLRLIASPGLIATIVAQDIPNITKGVLRDFKDRILVENQWMWHYIESYNKTKRVFTLKNGSILEFSSFKDAQDAHGSKRDILFVNEANGISWPIYEQLALRTSLEIFIDYNPTSEFWAHERLMGRKDSITFYSNFTHNPFIEDAVKEYIIELKYEDEESWRVYGLGKTGTIAEVCIENITIVESMPQYLKKRGVGLDFGYRANPSAMTNCGLLNERDVYLDEVFYIHRMKTRDIDIFMNQINLPKTRGIFADIAEPRAIDDLKDRGWNISGVPKGPDSVKYGIELLNQYNLYVTERSYNIIKEQKMYRWKTDNDGKVLNEPIKAFDHAWDGIRYWAMANLKPIRQIKWQYNAMSA